MTKGYTAAAAVATISKAVADAQEPTWNDWFASRVYFLSYFAKEPTKDARAIAKREMAIIRETDRREPMSDDATGKRVRPSTVLTGAAEEPLAEVVVVGRRRDGSLFLASSHPEVGEVMQLLALGSERASRG